MPNETNNNSILQQGRFLRCLFWLNHFTHEVWRETQRLGRLGRNCCSTFAAVVYLGVMLPYHCRYCYAIIEAIVCPYARNIIITFG